MVYRPLEIPNSETENFLANPIITALCGSTRAIKQKLAAKAALSTRVEFLCLQVEKNIQTLLVQQAQQLLDNSAAEGCERIPPLDYTRQMAEKDVKIQVTGKPDSVACVNEVCKVSRCPKQYV